MQNKRVFLYDSTLRDGAQTQGVDFSVQDKITIAKALDSLGIDYIEGGWPGANPTDDEFFASMPQLKQAKFTAFSMTATDVTTPGLRAFYAPLLNTKVGVACIVGKTWDFHVKVALKTSQQNNLEMIEKSIRFLKAKGLEVIFDAEHFFDGFKANKAYTLKCIEAAHQAGADWIVLCDTNGGSLPQDIKNILSELTIPIDKVGLHGHNDCDTAVSNAITAIDMGVRHIQGTLNGLGERCGNANLVSLIPTLSLKLGYTTGVDRDNMRTLTHISRLLDERLNRVPQANAPYVGTSAFAHKGGLHASAMAKDTRCYEHISPELVGNKRHIIISDQAGKSNVLSRLAEVGIHIEATNPLLTKLIKTIKEKEHLGYTFDGAEASFELLVRTVMGEITPYFNVKRFRVTDERRWNAKGKLITESEAIVKMELNNEIYMQVANGNGPVNALDLAMRKALLPFYGALDKLELVDYKVRIINRKGTEAVTRVMIVCCDHENGTYSTTVGLSGNIIDASFEALSDAITHFLYKHKVAQLALN